MDFPKTRKALERYDREVAKGPTGYPVFPWSPPDVQEQSHKAAVKVLNYNVRLAFVYETGDGVTDLSIGNLDLTHIRGVLERAAPDAKAGAE